MREKKRFTKILMVYDIEINSESQSSNISTTPITVMGCRQCLSLSVVQLKGKHCRKPNCHNGVVDIDQTYMFGLRSLAISTSTYHRLLFLGVQARPKIFNSKESKWLQFLKSLLHFSKLEVYFFVKTWELKLLKSRSASTAWRTLAFKSPLSIHNQISPSSSTLAGIS